MAERYIYRGGRVMKLRKGVILKDYLRRRPDAILVNKPPSAATMRKWMNSGVARALDGCRVEPDGRCPHGLPSWLLVLGHV